MTELVLVVAALLALYALGGGVSKAPTPPQTFPYEGFFRRYATSWGVPARLGVAIVAVESSFNPRAINHEEAADKRKGHNVDSVGLGQILYPDTATSLQPGIKLDDLFDPEVNLNLTFKLLAGLIRAYPGKEPDGFNARAVAAYNAGSVRFSADGTFVNQSYVDKVHRAWRGYSYV